MRCPGTFLVLRVLAVCFVCSCVGCGADVAIVVQQTESRAASPVFSPAAGTYSAPQSVTIRDATLCAGKLRDTGGRGGGQCASSSHEPCDMGRCKGKLWMFGGLTQTYGSVEYSDLWEFSPGTFEWAWMGGSSMGDEPGDYGLLGVPAAGNIPGARGFATSWTDGAGNLWMFGGDGEAGAGDYGYLSDVWSYQP